MILRITSAIIISAVLCYACGGQPTAEAPSATSDLAKLYIQNCATCHGLEGNLGIGGAKLLTESVSSRESVIDQIRNGKNSMPAFGDRLTSEEIEALADYVISLRPQNGSN